MLGFLDVQKYISVRYVFFKALRNMAIKCFKKLGLFMTVRHVCSWHHQLLQEEDGHQRDWFVSHLGKKILLPGLPDAMVYELDMQDP